MQRMLLSILMLITLAFSTVTATGADPIDWGGITGQSRRLAHPIAIPDFTVQGTEKFDMPLLAEIVRRDLALSGFFEPPSNAAFAAQVMKLDQQSGQINFGEWKKIGVHYLVQGLYQLEGQALTAEVKVYDISAAEYIFGRRYPKYTREAPRLLAHRISNDIIEHITGFDGVADTQLAYVRQLDPHGKTKQITVMDADGYDSKTYTPKGELCATPAWGARGTEIYYTTYRDFNPDLAGVILRTGQWWWVSRYNGFNLSPVWSPKREQIALTLTKDGNSELYTIDRAGKGLRRLTRNRAIDSSPVWSPDGSRIAFTSDRNGSPQIYIMDVQSLEAERLTFHGRYNDGAAWSPDGDTIAYCSRINGKFQIFTIGVDGTDLRQLTDGNHNNEDPTWAPNSKVLAFTSDRSGSKHIYSMFMDGSNVQQLTQGPASHSPAWSGARH